MKIEKKHRKEMLISSQDESESTYTMRNSWNIFKTNKNSRKRIK